MSEGICGDIYSNQSHHDYDMLLTLRNIKLYTPRTNNINNHPLLPLHDNEDYDACCFVEEDDNFPGYVKLFHICLRCQQFPLTLFMSF
jgi:hypothetical protein